LITKNICYRLTSVLFRYWLVPSYQDGRWVLQLSNRLLFWAHATVSREKKIFTQKLAADKTCSSVWTRSI